MKRFLIAIVAVVWGVSVSFSGYSDFREWDGGRNSLLGLSFAAIAVIFISFPLIIAVVLVVDQDKTWRKYLRRSYAILMLLCVTKLSVLS